MLRCPKCDKGFTEVRFSGWTVFTEGTAVIDGTGRIAVVGPMVAKCSIKPGHEIEGKHVQVYCPECGHAGHISSFPRVLQCFLSGGVGDMVITNQLIGTIAIAKEHQRVAEEILTPRFLDWDCGDETARVYAEYIKPVIHRAQGDK